MRKFIALSIIFAGAALTGCASITRGTNDQIAITTEPAGANISMNPPSQTCISPCALTVGRKDEFVLNATKDGYKPADVFVKTQMATAGMVGLAGNVLVGGVIGAGVDVATGATLEHVPNPVHLILEPIARPETAGHRRRAPKEEEAPGT